MRSLIFYAIIAYLFYGGITNFNKWREAGTPLETPIVGADLAGLSFGSFGFGESNVATNDKWEEILTGTWKFKTVLQEAKYKRLFEGKITYSPDGTFVRRISYTAISKRHGDVFIKAGGTIEGKWQVNMDSTWVETSTDCNIILGLNESASEDFSVCDIWFNKPIPYGVRVHDTQDFELMYFNNSKIEIKAKDLSDGLTDTYSFTRSDE